MAQNANLEAQIAFLVEVDKLKSVLRRNYAIHADRRENSAEQAGSLVDRRLMLDNDLPVALAISASDNGNFRARGLIMLTLRCQSKVPNRTFSKKFTGVKPGRGEPRA